MRRHDWRFPKCTRAASRSPPSGADIELVCRKASLAAIREFLESPAARSATLDGFIIRAEHFRTAMRELSAEHSEKSGRKDVH